MTILACVKIYVHSSEMIKIKLIKMVMIPKKRLDCQNDKVSLLQ